MRHNLSIIPPAEHKLEHNTLVSRVTPESIILYFLSIIRQTLQESGAFKMVIARMDAPKYGETLRDT